jgi:prepilin-type N-terminal cleavage/methylation domain-containing protein
MLLIGKLAHSSWVIAHRHWVKVIKQRIAGLSSIIYQLSAKRLAFTLVEMLIVLAIISMLMGITVPFTTGFGKGLRIKTAARAILGTLRVARSSAITYRNKQKVVFDVQKGEYWAEDFKGNIFEKKRRLPAAIRFSFPDDPESDPVVFENDTVIFDATGAVEGASGYIIISDKQGEARKISIISSTGKITIE